MKRQTVSFMITVNVVSAVAVLLASSSILLAGAPVFEAPAGNRMAVWKDVGIAGFSADRVDRPTLALDSNDIPYVAYRDYGHSSKATVMKFNGSSWVTVGPAGFSPGEARYVSIAMDNSNIPYVAYEDSANSSKATVMKFNGSSWVTVGSAGFSPDTASEISLVIDPGNTPYVLYEYSDPVSDESKLAVMKFSGSSWVVVGSTDFTAGEAYDSSLAIDGAGTPYVAFTDVAHSDKATVMKFNGSSWVTVGEAGFSPDYVGEYTDLAIAPNGAPYVVYEDGNDRRATVMKFDGGGWVTVGVAGFSVGEAHTPSIAIDSKGNPFVAYGDYAESEKLTVMKFDGSSWNVVGQAGLTGSYIFTPRIAIDDTDHPFVVYEDWGHGGYASVMNTIDGFQYEISESTTAVGVISASDPENDPITYGISEGDSAYFYLDSESGELRLVLASDFESPGDADGDNVYEFTVTASATGEDIATQVRVAITNVPEDPTFQVQPIWEVVGLPGFSYTLSSSPFLAVDGNHTPYVIYRASYQGQVAVQQYDGATWEYVGPEFNFASGWGISTGSAYETSLAFDSTDRPYLVYRDEADSNKVVVKQYDGQSWVSLGSGGFTAVSPNYTSIYPAMAIDSSDTPYVAYADAAQARKLTVMKFSGGSWVTVGSAGFSAGETMDNSIAIDSSDTPYVVYRDSGNANKVTVMKFDGSNWVTVGAAGFSEDWVRSTTIAIDSHDVVYVAYEERSGISYKSTVMRFNGDGWVAVGPPRFPSTDTADTFLAIDSNDLPYVAFAEKYPGGVTVMKYDGRSWGVVGTASFSDGSALSTTIAFGGGDIPHVGFWDYANGGRATVMKAVAGPMLFRAFENEVAVGSIRAVDPENDPITYSIAGGDSGFFVVDSTTGAIRFNTAPDFENPQDADFNNVYGFTATISAGGAEVSSQAYVLVLDDPENLIAFAPAITGDQLGFTMTGAAGTVVVVEACTDLSDPVWVELERLTLTDGSGTFSDPDPALLAGRFYRVRTL